MRNTTKISIILFCIVLFLLFWFFPRSSAITNPESITIHGLKQHYATTEDIVIGGRAPKDTDIIVFFNDEISLTESDGRGYWQANVGKATKGKYAFQVVARVSDEKDLFSSKEISVSENANFFAKALEYLKAQVLFYK